MKFNDKRRWGIVRDSCIGWTLAFVFLSIVRGVGTVEMGSVQFNLQSSILVSFIFGPIFGSISGYANILTEERLYKRISIQKLLLLRLIYAFLFLAILILTSFMMVTTFFGVTTPLKDFVFEPGSGPIYFYFLSVDIFMVVLRQVNLLLGENKLSQLLRGKFYTPHEEERVFMFLDLQASTQLAEKLGHIQYSMMLQDCFNDLGVVVENEAEIYQYVGDEVVLTWRLKDGIRNHNCVKAYFNFKEQLEKKETYYNQKYGCKPFFKAGMNGGVITVTEVGKYKKEIAYHGDAINTAARIQGKCNELNSELLVSEYLKGLLQVSDSYNFSPLGSVALKGKKREVGIYAISESTV